jgi:hypothetical protein
MGNGNQEPARHRRTAVRPAMVRSLIPASRRFRSGHSGQRMIGCRTSGPISAGNSSLVTSRSMRPDQATLRGMPSGMVEIKLSCAVTARRRAAHSLWRWTEPWSLGLLVRGVLPHVPDRTRCLRTVILTLASRLTTMVMVTVRRLGPRSWLRDLVCVVIVSCAVALPLLAQGPRRQPTQRRRHLPDGAAARKASQTPTRD